MKPITPKDTKLGFIGIGFMGSAIAQRLLQAGFPLTAYDRKRAKSEGTPTGIGGGGVVSGSGGSVKSAGGLPSKIATACSNWARATPTSIA